MESADIDDCFGKGARRFLRKIVPDAALDQPMLVLAQEFPGIGAAVRMRRSVGIALKRDGRHGNVRTLRQPLFQIVVLRLTIGQAEPPAVVMDNDGNLVRIVE